MRSMTRMIALAGACLLAVSGVAIADESVDAQLQELSDRMEQLEGELDAANAKVEAQEQALEEDRPGRNALSPYIESTDITAWVAASYNINFRNPDKTGASTGTTNQSSAGIHYPYFPESNTVQVDQVWIGIDKAPTDEARAGYSLNLAAGAMNNPPRGTTGAAQLNVTVFSGSASYMLPIMDGFTVEGGLLETAQGAEVAQTTANLNVSRGITWNTQPVTNVGFTGTLDMGGGLTVMAGMLNNSWGLAGTQDPNNNKALTSRVNYSADKFSLGAGVNWGKNESTKTGTGAGGDHLLFDVLASVDPTDNLTAYVDYTLNIFDLGGADVTSHSIAVATRLAVLDTTGIAVRGEVVLDDDGAFGGGNKYSITGTIDHELVDNLTAKVEVRYDGAENGIFWNGAGTTQNNEDGQTVGIIQLVYEF